MLLRKSMTSFHNSITKPQLLTTLLMTYHLFIQSSQLMSLQLIQLRSQPKRRPTPGPHSRWLLQSQVSFGHFTKVISHFHVHQRDPTKSMELFQDGNKVMIVMMTETMLLQGGKWWSCPALVPRKLAFPHREPLQFRATLAALIVEVINKILDHSHSPTFPEANPRAQEIRVAKVPPQPKLRIAWMQVKSMTPHKSSRENSSYSRKTTMRRPAP